MRQADRQRMPQTREAAVELSPGISINYPARRRDGACILCAGPEYWRKSGLHSECPAGDHQVPLRAARSLLLRRSSPVWGWALFVADTKVCRNLGPNALEAGSSCGRIHHLFHPSRPGSICPPRVVPRLMRDRRMCDTASFPKQGVRCKGLRALV